jgi:co-chaperonin GroES (HSP10)
MFTSNDYQEIIDHLGEDLPIADGFRVLLKLYTKDEKLKTIEGIETSLYTAPSAQKEETYTTIVGLVLAIGPDAYAGEKFQNWNKCKVGDWVLFPRNEGTRFLCKGVPLRWVAEDTIGIKIKNPATITLD